MAIKNLWIIMPVYNEEEAIEFVVNEWVSVLDTMSLPYTLCVLNDGSKDSTLQKLHTISTNHKRIHIIDKPNSGHGQTCIYGYQYALEQGADWIMQIDSDGQCDPQYFQAFIPETDKHDCIYGVRVKREDGLQRYMVSHFVSIFTMFAIGQWLRDPNVPYRLIRADVMQKIAYSVPIDFHLANIYITVLSNKASKIKWVPIVFRDRLGGTASVKTFSFIKHGFKLFKQLREAQQEKKEYNK